MKKTAHQLEEHAILLQKRDKITILSPVKGFSIFVNIDAAKNALDFH
jgi:hypothetical protein